MNKSALLEIGKTLSNLGKIEDTMAKFSQTLMSNIIVPYLSTVYDSHTSIEVKDNKLSLINTVVKADETNVINAIRMVLKFLITNLPQPLHVSLSSHLMQPLTMSLRLYWIEPSMLKDLNEMQSFDNETLSLRQLAEYIHESGWFGKDILLELLQSIPRLWIIRRKETALAKVRSVCSKTISSKIVAEKVELPISAESGAVDEKADHDWETDWPDDVNDEDKAGLKTNNHHAWSKSPEGLRNTKVTKLNLENKALLEPDTGTNEKGAVDDWDWDNEDTKSNASESQIPKQEFGREKELKGISENQKQNNEDVTRRVKYIITKIPDTLTEVIKRLIDDANQLSQPR